MTINDLTTKQLTEALKFVTGQEPKRFATRAAGLKRLQREMGAHGVTPQEVMAALGLDTPADVALRERADRDAREQAAWTAQQREHDDAMNAVVVERFSEEPEPKLRRDRHGFVRRVRAPKEVKPKAAGKAELILEMLTRPGGATHEEFKQATGWARCQSYPKQVAKRHGLTVTTVREGRTARYTAQRAG